MSSGLSDLARALPVLPRAVPADAAVVASLDCGRRGLVGICRWGGDGYMLVGVAREEGDGPDTPLTPLLTRDEIAAVAEGVLAGDARVLTWPLLPGVLALGTLLADVPRDEPPEGSGAPPPARVAAA